jgi:outer membrane scaffolding protein for murein synthesis (MipA/OmpV family)
MKSRYLALTILVLSLCIAMASKAEDSTGSSRGDNEFSWDISIAADVIKESPLILGTDQEDTFDYLKVSILLDIYYRGFFIQTNKHRYSSYVDGAEIGYELEVNENYEVDLISKIYLPGFSATEKGLFNKDKIEELQGINTREYLSNQGIRYMRYFQNAVYWVDVAADILNGEHHGWVIDGFYSYILQKRNWEIYLGAGASFFSSNMNNYYFSVRSEEARDSRPAYRAGAGYRLQIEAFVQHPISEGWLFNGGVTLSHYSNSISDSPLVVRENVMRAQAGVSYVF